MPRRTWESSSSEVEAEASHTSPADGGRCSWASKSDSDAPSLDSYEFVDQDPVDVDFGNGGDFDPSDDEGEVDHA